VSGYDTKVIDKVKVEPLPNQPKPETPRKTSRRFTAHEAGASVITWIPGENRYEASR
jgi:hypothetical protein